MSTQKKEYSVEWHRNTSALLQDILNKKAKEGWVVIKISPVVLIYDDGYTIFMERDVA